MWYKPVSCERFRAVACSRGRAAHHRAPTGREAYPMVAEQFLQSAVWAVIWGLGTAFATAPGSGGAGLQGLTGCITCSQVVVVAGYACLCQCLHSCVSALSVCVSLCLSLSVCLCLFERGVGMAGGCGGQWVVVACTAWQSLGSMQP